jgi:hypothetical protein
MSLRERILNASDIKRELITIEEWDNVVLEIRTLSGKARAHLLKSAVDSKGNLDFEKIFPDIIIATAYEPNTDIKVFEMSDRDLLNSKSAKCVEVIAKLALKLAGLDGEEVKSIEKN